MKQLFTICLLLISNHIFAQTVEDYTVGLTATTQVSPAKITLKWKRIPVGTPSYMVYKKAKGAIAWGSPIATVPTTDSILY